MNRYFHHFFFAALLIGVLGCKEKRNEEFYSKYEASDVLVAPIMDPYFIASTSGPNGTWYLDDGKGGVQVSFVASIDSIIASYYFEKGITNLNNRDTVWYIHVPLDRHVYKFTSKAAFYAQLSSFTSSKPSFSKAEDIYTTHTHTVDRSLFPSGTRL